MFYPSIIMQIQLIDLCCEAVIPNSQAAD